jgi:hypothetical protein
MENYELEIKARRALMQDTIEKSIHDELSSDLKISRNDLIKAFGKDLQKRFPNGKWVTMSGSHVFINNGKVVAGLEGFNKEVDKFFEGKKTKESKKEDKKQPTIPKHMQNDLDDAKRLINHYTKQGDTKRLETAKKRLKEAEDRIQKYKNQVGGGEVTGQSKKLLKVKKEGESTKEADNKKYSSMSKTVQSYIDNIKTMNSNELSVAQNQFDTSAKQLLKQGILSKKQVSEINKIGKMGASKILGGNGLNIQKENLTKQLKIMKQSIESKI